jgi:hypothetical protein
MIPNVEAIRERNDKFYYKHIFHEKTAQKCKKLVYGKYENQI